MTKQKSVCGTWNSPWGIEENSEIEENLFETSSHAFEYILQHNGVFVSMFDEKKISHSDSYGTIVKYDRLAKILDLIEEYLSPKKEDWQFIADEIFTNPNHQPPLKIVASEIVRRFKVKRNEVDYSQWV